MKLELFLLRLSGFASTLLAIASAAVAQTKEFAGTGRFIDVTQDSGVGEAMARHYERYAKWWLSGVNLVDLDGDGHLDLFLAAHGAGRDPIGAEHGCRQLSV